MDNFWRKLNSPRTLIKGQDEPFFVLAPMADVTDAAFRRVLAKYGKPDVIYTEFVPCDGLCSKGKDVFLQDLNFDESERPIVAQFFGATPENFYKSAKMAVEMGFDGIDINMGCPEKNIQKQGAGAALIKNPELAKEIIRATKEGAGTLPVSVKTRIGYAKNEIDSWISNILEEKPAVLTVHGRTKKEMSKVDAHWDVIADVVKMAKGSGVLIVGNGDVKSLKDGYQKAAESGVNGVMVGRATFGNPWFFNKNVDEISLEEKLKVMVEHTYLFEELVIKRKGFNLMKKHYKAYVSGFDGAHALRLKLMGAKNGQEVEKIVRDYLGK